MYNNKAILLIISIFNVCACEEVFDKQNNQTCYCVPYYQCSDKSGNIVTDGADLIDQRQHQQNSTCAGYFDTCCNFPMSTIEANHSEQPEAKHPEQPEAKHSEQPEAVTSKACGYPHSGSFSWSMALLYQASPQCTPLYKCGASLIHPQAVITAAHCLNIQGTWIIKAGDVERTIEKIILHQDYSSITLQNDLALLILNKPVETSDKLNTICIPPPGIVFDQIRCTVSSWNNNNGFNVTSNLKLLNLPLVSRDECLKALRSTRLGIFFQLDRSFICAGGEYNKDMCSGDGGSPLACPIANQPRRYYQAGIVSWGIGCGEFNIPGVYVNLGIYREWIDENMAVNGFNSIEAYRY